MKEKNQKQSRGLVPRDSTSTRLPLSLWYKAETTRKYRTSRQSLQEEITIRAPMMTSPTVGQSQDFQRRASSHHHLHPSGFPITPPSVVPPSRSPLTLDWRWEENGVGGGTTVSTCPSLKLSYLWNSSSHSLDPHILRNLFDQEHLHAENT
jgi:hypothetical protein